MLLLRNAEVYAPAPLGRRDLLVGGGRVLALAEEIPRPSGFPLEEVDAEGRRVIPGLVDAHLHLGGGGGESGFASRVPPLELGALARAGVTTAVGLLGTDTTTRSIEDLVARTLALREEGLSAWCWTGGYACPPLTLTGSVRRDLVFVDPIIGVGELAISDHRSSQPALEELLRVAADCHVAGLTTGKAGVLHLHVGDGPRGLALVRQALERSELPARVFQPTHVNRRRALFEEAVALTLARGVPIDVTAFPPEPPGQGDGEGLSAAEAIARCLADPAFPAAKLTCSSDGAGCIPVFDHDRRLVAMDVGRPSTLVATLQQLLADGVALERALPVFTANAADQLRLAGKGRIAVGGDADLVILDEHAAPRDVMARGRWLMRNGAQTMFGTFERGPGRAREGLS